MRLSAGICVLLVTTAVAASAQDGAATEQEPRVSQAIGIHYGSPLRASLSAGLLFDRGRSSNDGMVLMLEQGFQGSEVSAGYFKMFASFGSGYSLRAAVVRTGEEPWEASPHTTYVGGEAHTMLLFGVGGRVGYLRRASRSERNPHDTIITFALSIGH